MTDYGLTTKGFVRKPYNKILSDIIGKAQSLIDSDLDFLDTSPEGQIAKIFSDEADELWQHLERVYYSQYPSTSSGVSLDRAAAFTGNKRLRPRSSQINVSIVVPANQAVEPGTKLEFKDEIFTIVDGIDAYDSEKTHTLQLSSDLKGQTQIKVGDNLAPNKKSISSAVAQSPIVQGFAYEEDEDFKLRIFSQRTTGVCTLDAIETRLQQINGVKTAKVFYNNDNKIDINGRPPGSVEIVVLGGNDNTVAREIFNVVAPGTVMTGKKHKFIDTNGIERIVRFVRSIPIPILIQVNVTFEKGFSGSDKLEKSIQSSVAEKVNKLNQGNDLSSSPYLVAELNDIPNIFSVQVRIKRSADASYTNHITINDHEVARVAEKDITVAFSEASETGVKKVQIYCSLSINVSKDFPSNGIALVKSHISNRSSFLRPGENVSQYNILSELGEIEGILFQNSFSLGKSKGEAQFYIEIDNNEVGYIPESNITIATETEA